MTDPRALVHGSRETGHSARPAVGSCSGEQHRDEEAARRAPAAVEFLEGPPPTLNRLLALIDGRAYAATWLWTRTLIHESKVNGKVVRHDPPMEEKRQNLFVIRDDGLVFGPGGDQPLRALGIGVNLPSPPRADRLWSSAGMMAYQTGYRPSELYIFYRIRDLVDRFVSFDRSLAPQRVLCEVVACWAMATWFLDAFYCIGYLWPVGGFGSGKTTLGIVTTEVSYLGEVILAGSTYPCLRDLADQGARLLFDDAENLADPRRSDPDKRALLLAGNRKGSTIEVKEKDADGNWHTRHVNTYSPRLFTAINLPDGVLASRTIVLPLVRTADPAKANAAVLDYSLWPCDRRQLIDDLWALGLTHLSAIPAHEAAVNRDAPLLGRNLEPWRPTLSVAHFLDQAGEEGLYDRLVELSRNYQIERTALATPDLANLVVRALVDILAAGAQGYPSASRTNPDAPIPVEVADVTERVNAIAEEEDLAEFEGTPFASAKRVGRTLSTLRLKQAPKGSGEGRGRVTSLAEVESLARAYGVRWPRADPPPVL